MFIKHEEIKLRIRGKGKLHFRKKNNNKKRTKITTNKPEKHPLHPHSATPIRDTKKIQQQNVR